MKQTLYFADTEEYEIVSEECSSLDSAYESMEEAYEEQLEFYDSSVIDNGIEDEKAFIELDDGRRLFWNIK